MAKQKGEQVSLGKRSTGGSHSRASALLTSEIAAVTFLAAKL